MGVDVLAVGAHPDDVDMIAGGTVAKMVSRGRSVVIVDLTRGEMSSRGTSEERAVEAQNAADALNVSERIILDMGDGRLEDNQKNRTTLIEIVREFRPKIVMGHYWEDLHPDHQAAGHLLRSIMYPCGFSKHPAQGEPFRPHEFLFFMAHFPFEPSFIVDITDYHEKKMEAVKCFGSQLHSDDPRAPATGISQPDFLARLEARARYFGSRIDRTHGEPFFVLRSVPMDDPVNHYTPFSRVHPGKENSK